MNFKVRISFDWDESCYLVTVDGIPEISGEGITEIKAIIDFFQNYDKFKEKEYFQPNIVKQILAKYELLDDI